MEVQVAERLDVVDILVFGDEPDVGQGELKHGEGTAAGADARRVVVAGDDEGRDSGILDPAELLDEDAHRLPCRARMVEDIAGVDDRVDVPVQDVGHGAVQRALEVHRALVAAGVRILLVQRAVAKMGIGDVCDSNCFGHDICFRLRAVASCFRVTRQ